MSDGVRHVGLGRRFDPGVVLLEVVNVRGVAVAGVLVLRDVAYDAMAVLAGGPTGLVVVVVVVEVAVLSRPTRQATTVLSRDRGRG